MNREYSRKAQAAYLMGGKISSFLIRFIVPIILVRVFSKEDFGFYKQLLFISSFFIPILKFGVSQSLFYFFPIVKERMTQLLSQSFYYFVITGLVFLPLFYFFQAHIAQIFNNKDIIHLINLCGLFVVFTATSFLLEIIFILEKRSKIVFIYVFLNELIEVTVLLFALFVYRNIEAVFWVRIIMAMIRTVILFIYLKIKYMISIKINNWDKDLIVKQVKYVFPLGLATILRTIKSSSVKLILSIFFAASDFAVFAVGCLKIPLFSQFIASITNVTRSQIAKYGAQRKYDKAKALWHKQIETFISVSVPLVVYFLIMAFPVITFLYTEEYKESVNIFRILMMVPLLQSLSWGTIPLAFNATKYSFYALLFSTLIGVPSAYILVKQYGLVGAAISSVLLFALDVLYQIYKSKILLKSNYTGLLPWKVFVKILIICLILSVPLFMISVSDMHKAVKIIIGAAFFFTPLLFIYHKHDIINIKQIMADVFKKQSSV
ncbi:MAG: hypothetical protein CMG69_04005 [Candidatus Marinimicrobia bacterium]|nr:hypothetical protein [Candidatus Neomarinimicrobiota bacterium]|tara:strand:+ start:37494 stop:38966 length:1473 start_codon:yes stop_codon:yes gene_type:complete